MSLAELVQSSGWKNFMAKLYGLGASVVIIGALFKIQHWPFAGVMLTVGLFTESIIFFFSAFERFMKKLTGLSFILSLQASRRKKSEEDIKSNRQRKIQRCRIRRLRRWRGGSVALQNSTNSLKMQTSPALFEAGIGMKKLSETAENFNVMGDVTAASTKYMNTIEAANSSLGKLSETYQSTARIVNESNAGYRNLPILFQ